MSILLINSDSLYIPLADKSVQCVVTSPPYWGLRDYGVSGQLGLEPTPEEYVADMVAVFREVWRVLRDDGTCWMNLGDSYTNNPGNGRGGESPDGGLPHRSGMNKAGSLKPKDLVGIPWRVAFALQADGWYLRSDIIWHKPNPMPESVTDRPTKAHEYVFLLTKSPRYFYDQEAVREESVEANWQSRYGRAKEGQKSLPTDQINGIRVRVGHGFQGRQGGSDRVGPQSGGRGSEEWIPSPAGRNMRTVWTIATQPTPFAHFATYPEKVVEPCIKAGTSERGCCPRCGKAWERTSKKEFIPQDDVSPERVNYRRDMEGVPGNQWKDVPRGTTNTITTGWQPACSCNAGEPAPCVVLDPFAGSGTTGLVARRFGRHFVGLDLSHTYLQTIARKRLELDRLDAWNNGAQPSDDGWHDLPIFQEAQP